MFKKIAELVLKSEIQKLRSDVRELKNTLATEKGNRQAYEVLFNEEKKTSSQLREALDEKLKRHEYAPVSTVKDLQLTQEELKFYRELGENPVYMSIADKMATRVVLITSQQREITKEQMDRINGVREGICQIVWDIQNEKSKKETANPLTGEVTSK